ncbi:MAG: RsmE family RNA methyltransferase [Dehalococcoidia bacterium]|jgi:16S rRNA (uracil1498-N3)-methyltransferase
MQRFLVNRQCIDRDSIILEGDIVHQIRNVLRLQSGDRIAAFDKDGLEYTVIIDKVEKEQVKGTICHTRQTVEPCIKITLYQALLKSDHFEFVLQKCTEIGVSVFVPVICERCIVKKPSVNKIQRWEKVIKEATEQSGRGVMPILKPASAFENACHSLKGLSLIAGVGADSIKLSHVLRSNTPHSIINIFIGPEGGFATDEEELAQKSGLNKITLGPRVLRAETAGLVASTAILYEYGELNRPPTDIKL